VRAGALADLIARDLSRSLRTFSVAAIGITVGVATLAFFLALSAGMREVVLGRIFPLDRVEVVPPESSVGSVLSVLGAGPAGIEPSQVAALRRVSGVRAVLPRMRFAFPTSGRGGRAIFGRDVGAGEIPADGVDASLVRPDLGANVDFSDNDARSSHSVCASTADCARGEYCVFPRIPGANVPVQPGQCTLPIPAVVSPYLVEVFDGVIAPSHHLPRLGGVLLRQAEGLVLEWDLGRAGLGGARQGTPRRVYAKLVGISRRAMDLGITVPLDVARRLNREYAGGAAAETFSSVEVYLRDPSELTRVSGAIRAQGLEIRTSGAEQMGLLVTAITVILSLASVITVIVAALNIAHVFLTLIAERRGEIGLMRALGATRGDVRAMVLGQSLALGLMASTGGLLLARLAAFVCDHLARTRLPPFPFKPDAWFVFSPGLVGAVFAFGIGACVLSALVPASRAAKVEPASALSGGV
jgi:putative ABC transport system permease protein